MRLAGREQLSTLPGLAAVLVCPHVKLLVWLLVGHCMLVLLLLLRVQLLLLLLW
jgi:hypothetical protein